MSTIGVLGVLPRRFDTVLKDHCSFDGAEDFLFFFFSDFFCWQNFWNLFCTNFYCLYTFQKHYKDLEKTVLNILQKQNKFKQKTFRLSKYNSKPWKTKKLRKQKKITRTKNRKKHIPSHSHPSLASPFSYVPTIRLVAARSPTTSRKLAPCRTAPPTSSRPRNQTDWWPCYQIRLRTAPKCAIYSSKEDLFE